MSVRELKETLEKVAAGADDLATLLQKFSAKNADDLTAAMKVLDGTSTGTDANVRTSLNDAKSALDEARRAMTDAANAARDYASRV